jgi:hypothetical protein
MVATARPVLVCSYLTRDGAEGFAARLRRRGIATAVVPSDERPGAWDVLVPASDAGRANTIVDALLVPH